VEDSTIQTYINIRARSIYDPNLDEFSGKNLFKVQFDRAQELFSNSTFSKEVLDIINHELGKNNAREAGN
jgi:hypothetical protein